jgi:hypothetical protein
MTAAGWDTMLGRRIAYQYRLEVERPLHWQLRWLAWNAFLRVHLSREERLALFCHRMNFDSGSGLSDGAMKYYGKGPDQLSDLEIAGLIASDSRGRYASPLLHRDHFESVRQDVLAKSRPN